MRPRKNLPEPHFLGVHFSILEIQSKITREEEEWIQKLVALAKVVEHATKQDDAQGMKLLREYIDT